MSAPAPDSPSTAPAPDPVTAPGRLVAYAPFAKWSPHFETDLEIVQSHLDAGGSALVLACEGALPTCEPNPDHAPAICALCTSRFRAGMRWLRGDVQVRPFLALDADERAQAEALARREWTDLAQVRACTIEGADIGMAALSSLVSACRDSEPDLRVHGERLGRLLASAAMVYFSLRRQLAGSGASSVAIFNGRFAAMRPALRVARQLGIPVQVHERAGYPDRFHISHDTYPHDLGAIKEEVLACQPPGGLDAAQQAAARSWYDERRAGIAQSWISFTAQQDPGRVPAGMEHAPLNVAIFNSSEDEFVAIEEWANPFYPTQNEAVRRIVGAFAGDPRIRFHLRVHPNLRGLDNTQTRGLDALRRDLPNLEVIDAGSPVSSYALVDAADLVLAFGSTIGLEAAYAGKTSILMGRSMYEDLGTCLRPASHDALVSLLADAADGRLPAPPPDPWPGLLAFGHFQRVRGQPFAHVVPDGLFGARMRRDGRTRPLRAALHRRVAYGVYCLRRMVAGRLSGRPRP
jgi:hypothetical protein